MSQPHFILSCACSALRTRPHSQASRSCEHECRLASSFSAWHGALTLGSDANITLQDKIAHGRRRRQAQMLRAWHGWAAARLRRRALCGRAALRLQRLKLRATFSAWTAWMNEQRHMHKLVQGRIHRRESLQVHACWTVWVAHVNTKREKQHLLQHATKKVQRVRLRACLAFWGHVVSHRVHNRHVVARQLQRAQALRLSQAWRCWRKYVLCHAVARCKLAAVAAGVQPNKRDIFRAWKEQSVCALEGRVLWALRTWASNVQAAQLRRAETKHFEASQRQNKLRSALHAWRSITQQVWAARRTAQQKLDHTFVRVRPAWMAGAVFDAWAVLVREQTAAREAVAGHLADVMLAWRALTRSNAGRRRRLQALQLRQERRVLASAVGAWSEATRAAKHEVWATYRAQAHLLRHTLAPSFACWRARVAEEREDQGRCAAALRKISKGLACRTFHIWAELTVMRQLARAKAVRLQQQMALRAMRAAFMRWQGALIAGQRWRAAATSIRRRADSRLLQQVLHEWGTSTCRQQAARLLADKMFGKLQRARLRRAWLVWQNADECGQAVAARIERFQVQWRKLQVCRMLQAWSELAQSARADAKAEEEHQRQAGLGVLTCSTAAHHERSRASSRG
jgi:hypothetical protein